MRRILLILSLTVLAVAAASAQTVVSVYARLYPDTAAGPHATVRVMSLLDDPDWRSPLLKSIPIRLEWSVQLWQHNRGLLGLGTAAGPKVEWKEMIRYNSVLDVYEITTTIPRQRPTIEQFKSVELLALAIGQARKLEDFGPKSSGEWHYRVTLKLFTLTGDEIAKLDPSRASGNAAGFVGQLYRAIMTLTAPSKTLLFDGDPFRFR